MKQVVSGYEIKAQGVTELRMHPEAETLSVGRKSWQSVMLYCGQPADPICLGSEAVRSFVALRTNEKFDLDDELDMEFVATVNLEDGGPLLHVFELVKG